MQSNTATTHSFMISEYAVKCGHTFLNFRLCNQICPQHVFFMISEYAIKYVHTTFFSEYAVKYSHNTFFYDFWMCNHICPQRFFLNMQSITATSFFMISEYAIKCSHTFLNFKYFLNTFFFINIEYAVKYGHISFYDFWVCNQIVTLTSCLLWLLNLWPRRFFMISECAIKYDHIFF